MNKNESRSFGMNDIEFMRARKDFLMSASPVRNEEEANRMAESRTKAREENKDNKEWYDFEKRMPREPE